MRNGFSYKVVQPLVLSAIYTSMYYGRKFTSEPKRFRWKFGYPSLSLIKYEDSNKYLTALLKIK